LTKRIT